MSGATTSMNASLTLRLQDRLSAGLGALKQRLDGIRASAERIGAMGALGSAFAVGAPIVAAASLDKQLRDIAVTAGLTGTAAEQMISRLRRQFELLAIETAQSSRDVATAAGLMMQRGLATDLIEKMLPITAKVATGTSSAIGDVAGVVYDLNQTLDVTPDKISRALAMLVQASREGKVELRDMAKEFPALASEANNFGLRGLEGVKVLASAMQMAAKASATPAEAATNLSNLLSALLRADTREKIKKLYGFDFKDTLADAAKKGINPLEASVQKIKDITKGDPFALKELIPDLQANKALLPFIKASQEYLDLRDRVGAADPAILDQSFEVMMAGATAQIAILNAHLQRLSDRFGTELFSRIGSVLAPLKAFSDLIDLTDEMAPGLVGKLLTTAASLLALAAVLGTLVTVLPIFLAGMRVIGLVLRAAFFFVPLLTNGLAALAAVAGTIAAPLAAVLAVVALLGGIAYTIWANWSEFEGFFSGMWGGLRAMLQGFIRFLDGVFSLDMATAIAGLRLMWEGFAAFFESLWGALSLVMDKWVDGASAWVTTKVQAVVDAFKKVWTDVRDWFANLWNNIRLPTGPDLSSWSNRPSRISNEPVGAGLRRGLSGAAGAIVGPGAGDFVLAPDARQRVDLYINAPPGVVQDVRTPEAWTARQQELIDAYRPGRGPVTPSGRP